jgi:hypothetical protein
MGCSLLKFSGKFCFIFLDVYYEENIFFKLLYR